MSKLSRICAALGIIAGLASTEKIVGAWDAGAYRHRHGKHNGRNKGAFGGRTRAARAAAIS